MKSHFEIKRRKKRFWRRRRRGTLKTESSIIKNHFGLQNTVKVEEKGVIFFTCKNPEKKNEKKYKTQRKEHKAETF